MATIEKFEDLEIWQLARKVNKDFYNEVLKSLPNEHINIKNQIDRSLGSIMDNISEGFERNGTRELIQFLSVAKASTGEAKSQLYRMFDREILTEVQLEKFKGELTAISNKTSSFMKYLNGVQHKGTKFLREPEVNYGNSTADHSNI
jgi:four helix bundle protein